MRENIEVLPLRTIPIEKEKDDSWVPDFVIQKTESMLVFLP